MRILFISRSTLYDQPGGDTVQVEQTARYLRALGVEVHIQTRGFAHDFQTYDALHFFNLGRPADILPYLQQTHPPLLTTAIYIDYSKVPQQSKGAKQRWLHHLTTHFGQEYIKSLARGIKGSDRMPPARFLAQGYRKSVQQVLDHSRYLFTASQSEWRLISRLFHLKGKHKQLALGTEHFAPSSIAPQKQEQVLCVARFEALKNQLNLVRAQAKGKWPLVLVGDAAKNQYAYRAQCQKEAGENVQLLPFQKGKALAEAYARAKVHALPSFYETTGLATLEALLSGCAVVCGKGGAQAELYEGVAHFCEASDPDSIRRAVDQALESNTSHESWVRENFSWEKTARELLCIYQEVQT